MQTDVHKTLHPFYPVSLGWLNLNSQSFVWNLFYISAIRNVFLFINRLLSIVSALSTSKSSFKNNRRLEQHSDDKTRKLDTLAKLFPVIEKYSYTLTRLSHNLLKLENHAGLKNWEDESRKLATASIALHLVLTKKSKLNLNDKDVFAQACMR